MLVDFSDEIKLGGVTKPIMVDLSDEKKQPWMFTLDGLILFRMLDAERWTAASLLGRRSHSILKAGRSLNERTV